MRIIYVYTACLYNQHVDAIIYCYTYNIEYIIIMCCICAEGIINGQPITTRANGSVNTAPGAEECRSHRPIHRKRACTSSIHEITSDLAVFYIITLWSDLYNIIYYRDHVQEGGGSV